MMKWHGVVVVAFSLLQAPPPVEACGVKLVVKSPSPRRSGARPIRTDKPQPVVAARNERTPVAAGPKPQERKIVAAKTAPPPKPPPTPKVEKVETPKPIDTAPITRPNPTPKPDPTPRPAPQVAVSAPQEIYFGIDSKAVGRPTINKAVRWLTSDPSIHVVIEGHADPTGNADHNLTLSQTRAEIVRDQLVAAGIDSSRLEVKWFGDTKLKYGRTDGRNRRVVIVPKP